MVQAFNDYIRNIMYLVVFMSFAGMIMPDGGYRKYVDVVMGLVLIIAVITPIAALFGTGVGGAMWNSTFTESVVIADDMDVFISQHERMMSESINSIVGAQVSRLIDSTGFMLIASEADFSPEGEFLELRLIVARDGVPYTIESEETAERRQFIRVERVEVSLRESRLTEYSQHEELSEVEQRFLRNIISDFYNISPGNIHIELRKT